MRELKVKNTGFIEPKFDPKEYVFGGLSGIVHEDRNTIGDWRKWQPTDEQQNHRFFDDFGCVSNSATNICEITFGWFFENNLIRLEDLEWLKYNGYFDSNGKINFDNRALIILSGTRPGSGNTMQAVWDAARKFGLWPQGATPFREDMSQSEYYNKSDFPQKSYELGQEFLKRFLIQYERVSITVSNLKRALKHSPLHIGIPLCDGYNGNNVVNSCNLNASHAVTLTHIDSSGVYHIYDSYDPFNKRLAKTYVIPFAYKGVISPIISISGKKHENHIFEKNLSYGDYDNEVVFLCNRLIEEDLLPDFNPPSPHYGPEVRRGVLRYQQKYNVGSYWSRLWYQGKYCHEQTRNHLNLNLRGNQF